MDQGRATAAFEVVAGTNWPHSHFPVMPRYFFNIHHDEVQIDNVGEELPDQHAAWKEATQTAGHILRDIDGKLRPGHDWKMEITDEFRNLLFVLHISAKKPVR